MNENEIKIEHITPEETSLSFVEPDQLCTMEGCNRTFKSSSVLRFHQAQYHNHRRVTKQKKNHHIEERFHCPVKDCIYYYSACTLSRYFAKLHYLKQHYLRVHSTCSFPCSQCNKRFSTKPFLRAHQQYCDLDIVCSCGQNFSCITGLQTHVRRMGHESEVLKVYYARLNEKKNKNKESNSKQQLISKNHPIQPKRTVIPSTSSGPILPKPKSQPPHLVAAIALSELAFAGLKSVSTVEVGVQTDPTSSRKVSRKSSSPFRSRESNAQKRKQTTEMETQTQLTDLKNKVRKKGAAKKVAHCNTATDTSSSQAKGREVLQNVSESPIMQYKFVNDRGDCNIGVCERKELLSGSDGSQIIYNDPSGDLGNSNQSALYVISDQVEIPYGFFKDERSGAQEYTSQPIHASDSSDVSSTVHYPSVNPSISMREISIQASENDYETVIDISANEEEQSSVVEIPHRFSTSQIFTDEEDNLVSMSPSGRLSPVVSRRPPKLSSQNRSSSIETQTDHDVFLSTHVQTPDDTDDIILTSSETQTCEDFSDIEPFLCSTIHTQTVDDQNSSSELFPELTNFTVDMQTQTGFDDDSPIAVTTQTQTNFADCD